MHQEMEAVSGRGLARRGTPTPGLEHKEDRRLIKKWKLYQAAVWQAVAHPHPVWSIRIWCLILAITAHPTIAWDRFSS